VAEQVREISWPEHATGSSHLIIHAPQTSEVFRSLPAIYIHVYRLGKKRSIIFRCLKAFRLLPVDCLLIFNL